MGWGGWGQREVRRGWDRVSPGSGGGPTQGSGRAARGGHLRRRAAVTQGGSAATVPAGRQRRCPRSGAWSW